MSSRAKSGIAVAGIVAALVIGAVAWRLLVGAAPQIDSATSVHSDKTGEDRSQDSSAATAGPAETPPTERVAERTSSGVPAGRALLHGYVVDRDGRIVPDAQLQWVEPDRPISTHSPPRRFTAEDGEYAIPRIHADLIRFRVEAKEHETLDLTLDCRAGGILRHDFRLARSNRLPIRLVTPEGEPLLDPESRGDPTRSEFEWGLTVVASEGPLPPLPPTTNATWHGLGLGKWTKRDHGDRSDGTSAEPCVLGVLEVDRLPVDVTLLFKHLPIAHWTATSAEPITFTLDPEVVQESMGGLRLCCIDADSGEPLPSVRVQASDDQRGGGGLLTDAEGVVEFSLLAPGWIHVVIPETRHQFWEAYVPIEPGRVTDLGDLELSRSATLRGTLVDADGKPATADLQRLGVAGRIPGTPFGSNHYWGMDEPGQIEIAGFGRGRWLVIGWRREQSGAMQKVREFVQVGDEDPAPVAWRLAPATRVTIAPGWKGGEILHAELVADDGAIEFAGFLRAPWTTTQHLLPGGYTLTFFEETSIRRIVSFEVGREPIRVAFALDDDSEPNIAPDPSPPPSTNDLPGGPVVLPTAIYTELDRTAMQPLAGTLRDRAGAALPEGRVIAMDRTGRVVRGATGADGAFAIVGLTPGTWDVVASADSFLSSRRRLEIESGIDPPSVEITLDRHLQVRVRAVDLEGAPFTSALVRQSKQLHDPRELAVIATREPVGARIPLDIRGVGVFRPSWNREPNDELGTLDVHSPPPVHVTLALGGLVLASRGLAEPAGELVFVVDPSVIRQALASLRFRLIDARTREPILEAFAGVCTLQGSTFGEPATLPPESDGVRTLEDLFPGRRKLCVNAPGIPQTVGIVVDLRAGELTDLGDVELLRDTVIQGTLVDEAGAPIAGEVRIVLDGADGRPQWDGGWHVARAESSGRFECPAVAPRFRLEPRGEGIALDPVIVDAEHAAVHGVRVVQRTGVPVNLLPALSPGDVRVVAIQRADGTILARRTIRGVVASTVRLVPGSYRLVVESDDAAPEELAFEVAGEPVEIEID